MEAFAQGLRRQGYQAEIDKSDLESPNIFTGLSGSRTAISFSSCTGMDCDYVEIISSWKIVDRTVALKVIQEWNREERFSGAVYLESDQTVAVYHYILLGKDGITLQNLIENLEYFSRDYEELGKHLAGGQ